MTVATMAFHPEWRVERLSLPIVVIPALAELAQQAEQRSSDEMAPAPAGLPAVS